MSAGAKYAVGIDFGTLSARAVLVRVSDGAEIASATHAYRHGVIDETLPTSGERLPPEWALQHPLDWVEVLRTAVPAAVEQAGVDPADVIGVGTDFTACTMLPVTADGAPLCTIEGFAEQRNAWPKLWKHHASQPQADRITERAHARVEPWIHRYGGKISSEWFFSKALQILEESPEAYRAADRLIEAADWIVWQLTGRETRNVCTAGYKGMYQDGAFPSREYFGALHEEFAGVVDEKMSRDLMQLGERAGSLTEEAAAWTGLRAGIAVSVGNVDAHVTLPATGSVEAGTMVMIMGTSTCDVLVGEELREVEGMAGVVMGGIVPGRPGFEAGQSGVGDIFAWFVDHAVPPEYHRAAEDEGIGLHELLERESAQQAPGEHGLVALDWLNGNRTVLVDAELSGILVGHTLATRPADIYRALLESTAFGKRVIIETFEDGGVPIQRLVAAGGLPMRNRLIMQIYADVLQRDIHVIGSEQAPALGSAMHAAVAAGAYPDIAAAAAAMGGLSDTVYRPNPEHVGTYDELYREYVFLHDMFGRSGADDPGGVMKRLRSIRDRARRNRTAHERARRNRATG